MKSLLLLPLMGALTLVAAPSFSSPLSGNELSTKAAAALEATASRDPKSLSDVELAEWANARITWIALKRLQGREAEALEIFSGCAGYCEKHGPEAEWRAQKAWGCQKKREANPCLSSKTKAQKPSR